MDIITESNALLGPGLAYNYWTGFLKLVLPKLRQSLDEFGQSLEDLGVSATVHPKLIVLLPDNCSPPDESTLTSDGQVEIEVAVPGRTSITMKMNWILDDNDEELTITETENVQRRL